MTTAATVPVFTVQDRMMMALHHAKLTASEMAEYFEVNPATVHRWVNGRTRPSTQTLRVWAMKCGVPYEWLRDGEEDLVRHQGLEPRTRWFGASPLAHSRRRTLRLVTDRRAGAEVELVAA